MQIEQLDHLVLTVKDIATTCDFYRRAMGMEVVTFDGGVRIALAWGTQKINLHQQGREWEPKAQYPTPGSADLCFIAAAASIEEVVAHLQQEGVALLEGPVPRTGARGAMMSVYLRDPDANLIEISVYNHAVEE